MIILRININNNNGIQSGRCDANSLIRCYLIINLKAISLQPQSYSDFYDFFNYCISCLKNNQWVMQHGIRLHVVYLKL